MSDIGRIPLWMVATVGGLAALGLLTLFFFGAYSGSLLQGIRLGRGRRAQSHALSDGHGVLAARAEGHPVWPHVFRADGREGGAVRDAQWR